jgi:ankyrin repeat protein
MTALHHALSSLPKTLDETYSRILNNVDEDDRPAIRRIFQWLCFSRRSLLVEEIGTIYLLAEPFEFPLNTEQDLFQPDGILDPCRGLFILKDVPSDSFGSRFIDHPTAVYKTVQLAHFSVKEYLISACSLFWRLDELQSHLSIIKASTAYFMYVAASEDAKALNVFDLIDAYPLAEYATRYSGEHLDALNPREHPDLLEMLQCLFDPRSWSQCLLNNLHMIYATKRYLIRWDPPDDCSSYSEFPTRGFAAWSLISVSRLGLVEPMKWLLSFEDIRSEINTFFDRHRCRPPVVEASACGHAEIVQLLLNASANPNQCGSYHDSALDIAAQRGDSRIVRILIDAGADVNRTDEDRASALYKAAIRGHVQVMQMLVDAGAELGHGSHTWNSALCAASENVENPAALQLLLQGGSTVYRRSVYRHALRTAIQESNVQGVRMLLDVGQPETDSKEHSDGYAIQAASFNGDKGTLQRLIDSGGDVNAQGGYFSSALYAATLCGRADIVQMLLKAGADPNLRKGSESPVLQIAAAKGYAEIVAMLVAAGADVNEERGLFGGCVLQVASVRGMKEIVHILLQGGADVNRLGGKYGSSLQAACACGDQKYPASWYSDAQTYQAAVKLLLAAGADVNQQGGKYGSALKAAMAWKKGDIVKLLLEAGATPVDTRDVPPPVPEWDLLPGDDQSERDSDSESDLDNVFADTDSERMLISQSDDESEYDSNDPRESDLDYASAESGESNFDSV